jgi:hypothetical protein
MEDSLSREGALALVIVSLVMLVLGGWAFMWSSPHKHPGPMTTQEPAPYHIEWETQEVGGFHLLSPVIDSTGQHMQYVLPMGTILMIPHEVEGPGSDAPDSIRTRS